MSSGYVGAHAGSFRVVELEMLKTAAEGERTAHPLSIRVNRDCIVNLTAE
jgi:hypothetical protein